jgi:hypothetical protein
MTNRILEPLERLIDADAFMPLIATLPLAF